MCSTDCVRPYPATGTEFPPRPPPTLEPRYELQHAFPGGHLTPLLDGMVPQFLPCLGETAGQVPAADIDLNWQELMSLTEGLEMTSEVSVPQPDAAAYYPGDRPPHVPEPWPPYPLPQPLTLPSPAPEPWLLGEAASDSGLSLDSSPEAWAAGGVCWGGPRLQAGGGSEAGLGLGGLSACLVPPQAELGPQPPLGLTPEQPLQAEPGLGPKAGREACSRDERRARALRIPIPTEAIVHLPVEDYNELLARHRLTEAQLALVRDIRRRGKNKVAAQHCRRRKLEGIARLQRELGGLRLRRAALAGEREEVGRALLQARAGLAQLCHRVLAALRDPRGRPYPPAEFSLQVGADGGVFLLQEGGGGAD